MKISPFCIQEDKSSKKKMKKGGERGWKEKKNGKERKEKEYRKKKE